jgi:signal peptidase I
MGKKKFVGQEYLATTDGKGLQEDTASARVLARIAGGLSVSGIILSVFVVAFTLIFFLSPIDGTSMMKTLNATGADTDAALVNRLATPERGDIIITKLYAKDTAFSETHPNFKEKDDDGRFQYIIKRLIAKAGDRVSIQRASNGGDPNLYSGYNYYIYVNGEKTDESRYLDTEVAHPTSDNFLALYKALVERQPDVHWKAFPFAQCVDNGVLTIPDGYWFYMGDNRGGNNAQYPKSWDCSSLGPQKAEYYIGRADDILAVDESVPAYLWRKFCYYVLFGWIADI